MVIFMTMKAVKISRGGQISVPAEVRRRWNTSRVTIDDRGEELVVRPAPDDPITALRGTFADRATPTSDELRATARTEERQADQRRRDRP